MRSQDDAGEQDKLWKKLGAYSTLLSFPQNNVIYTPDESADWFYFLVSGQVNLYLISPGGRILSLHIVEPGGSFGHSSLTGSSSYDTFAEAIKPVQAMSVNRKMIVKVLQDCPEIGLLVVEKIERYVLSVSRKLDELAFKSVTARLASVLLNMVDGSANDQHPRLPRRTHQQLAEMTNTYRETVTKVINQLQAKGVLHIDRSGITLLDLARLRELAQE